MKTLAQRRNERAVWYAVYILTTATDDRHMVTLASMIPDPDPAVCEKVVEMLRILEPDHDWDALDE